MFARSECVGANQTGPMLMKLATICDISHVISYTTPSSPLFFFWGHREEGLGSGNEDRNGGCRVKSYIFLGVLHQLFLRPFVCILF